MALALAACGGGADAGSEGGGPATLNIGYIPDVHGGGLVSVANKQGFWKQAGVDPNLQQFTDGPTQIQAMAGGDLDIAYIGPGATYMPASGQAVVITLDSLNTEGDFLIGQPGIDSVADIQGKKVGVPEGTSGDMILTLALQRAGLSRNDIKVVPLDPPTVPSAFVSGEVDVAATWEPFAEEIRSQVPNAHMLATNSDFFPKYGFPQMWVASNELVEERPDDVKRFLTAFVLANDYRAEHPTQTVEWTATLADVPAAGLAAQEAGTEWMTSEQIIAANKGSTSRWMKGLQRLSVQFGAMDQVVPPQDFVNTQLLQKAKADM
jgi:NitT/TauT family transport system substrate-binding protein